MSTPTVSVLLPTYNQARFLPDALAALEAQTYRDFEVIACDDGSTDETAEIFTEWRQGRADCRVIHLMSNRGTAAAINEGARLAWGHYLTWVSSDNVMHPDWLAMLVGAIEQDEPFVGAVYSAYERHSYLPLTTVPHVERPAPYARNRLISSDACYFGPSFLIRREVWQEHRGGTAHDYDSWARVEEACWAKGLSIRYVDKVLCTYRTGPWQTGRQRPDLYDAPHWRNEAIKRRQLARTTDRPAAAAYG